jgi:hypothetical protein
MPGILIGLLIMTAAVIVSRKNGYGGGGRTADARSQRSAMSCTWRALPSLLLVVFVLGGILSGVVHTHRGLRRGGVVGIRAGSGLLPRSDHQGVAADHDRIGAHDRDRDAAGGG